MSAHIESFFDPVTSTWSHVVCDTTSGDSVVIDPVLDFCPDSGTISNANVEKLAQYLRRHQLTPAWIVETHAHADHLSGAQFLKSEFGSRIAIGEGICSVQNTFKSVFNLPESFATDGSQFDLLLGDGATLSVGALSFVVMSTPGHTSDSISLRLGDAVFIGDTMFSPEYGTARCDFPGGDASTLYRSIHKLFALPESTRLYLCHDYPFPGQAPRAFFTVAEQRRGNIHIGNDIPEADFIALRESRDEGLPVPRLLLPSVQVNIRAGALPAAEDNGMRYLKIPITTG